MSDSLFRIHPAIGFARVGTSNAYYLAPETLAGHPLGDRQLTGGLPIKPGTEDTAIQASDLRDENGAMKRQAARFHIFQYAATGTPETYPIGQQGTEIRIGSTVQIGGTRKTITDILWSVHIANKKTSWYVSDDENGIIAWYKLDPPQPPVRNPLQGTDPNDPARLKTLIIDPGPRTIAGSSKTPVQVDRETTASYLQGGAVKELPNYPKTFPQDAFPVLYPPGVEVIDTLGTLETDDKGRLIVAGGFGRANSINATPPAYGFVDAVNNDDWFDDTGDGPVHAVLVLDDGTTQQVQGGAWVISTDPAYAPQILNAVSLWDDIYDSWVRKLDLRPELFTGGQFVADYNPSFESEVRPIFLAAGLQRWVTNLSTLGISAHARVAALKQSDDPATTQLHGLGLIREPVDPDKVTPFDPNNPNQVGLNENGEGRGDPNPSGDDRRMPLGLGDAGRSLLSLSQTQYFYLQRWDRNTANDKRIVLNRGELLDKAALVAGLGGRFSPGIDMTYICREPDLYVMNWQTSGTGPFRISPKPLDYASAGNAPFLSLGWTPRRNENALEPGDISKFMAIPWHADYNSCGTHQPDPNPPMTNTLYWSWPAQRPVATYVAADVKKLGGKTLPDQRYSIRGPGTKTTAANPPPFGPPNPAEVGRYQQPTDAGDPGTMRILDNWMKIGTIMQATNIDDGDYDPTYYLEVQSQLSDNETDSDVVVPWPNTVQPTEPT